MISSSLLHPSYFPRLLLLISYLILFHQPLFAQGSQLYYQKILPILKNNLANTEKKLGPEHPDTATCLVNIAFAYNLLGDYSNALPPLERALAIRENTIGRQHPDTAEILHTLALVYESIGNYSKALQLNERALAIREKALGMEHPDTANSIHNLGNVYRAMRQYDKALPLRERALNIAKKTHGPEHFFTAISLAGLANIYQDIGDINKALPLHARVLELFEKISPPKSPDLAIGLLNLANIYQITGDYQSALPLLERALDIQESSVGPNQPQTAKTLTELASVYQYLKDYDSAIALYNRALAIYRSDAVELNNPFSATIISYLATLYEENENFEKALQLFKHSLSIREKNLSPGHPDIVNNLIALARVTYRSGDFTSASHYAIRYATEKQKEMHAILTLDERSRLAWQWQNYSYWTICVLPPKVMAQLLLSEKGIVLDSIAEDKSMVIAAGQYSEGAAILRNIASLQIQLSEIIFEKINEEDITNLEDEIGRLQRELAAKYLGRDRQRSSATLTMADIIPALAGGGVLLDFIEFEDPKLKGEEAACLGVIITGGDNNSIFVRIDGGIAINRSIEALRTSITQNNASDVEAQTKFLSEKLWAPIAAKIPEGTKRLFLCPDSNLNFLSFATLLESDGHFVAEKYPIIYIGSARDLAKKPSNKTSKSMALIANPQFDANVKNAISTEQFAMRSAEADVFGSIALPPLPGTETEAAALEALASQSDWQTKSYLGVDATETSVRNIQRPGVLHLATHGFYLNSFIPLGSEGSRGMSVVGVKETAEEKKKMEHGVDPMRASGVALTGAQQTLASWSQRKAPNPETDGILTAEEVGALRLDGTWLVTLSACETGVGEARSGEGVFGLRRAFMIAGAENLLMTLWPVADETTAKIMTDFYQEAFATGDAPGSLAKVQRDWLVKLRQERGLVAAVRDAGPFALVAMTNSNAPREFVEGQIQVAPDKPVMPKSDHILDFQVALAKADAGDAYAQAVISIYYGFGLGCDQNSNKSKEYVVRSAKQLHPLGIYRLAEMRETGEAMDKNSEQARQLMQKAKPELQKLTNDPYALTALATIYERENPDSPKIRELLTKASEMGYEPAAKRLSSMESPRY